MIIYDQRSPRGRVEPMPPAPVNLPRGFGHVTMSWREADESGQARAWLFPAKTPIEQRTCALEECAKAFTPSMKSQVYCEINCGVRADTIRRREYFRERARRLREAAR